MMTIYKFPIRFEPNEPQLIKVPLGATPLCVAMDPNLVPCIWCKVDADQVTKIDLPILVIVTGGEIPSSDWKYLGTLFTPPFVWHVLHATND